MTSILTNNEAAEYLKCSKHSLNTSRSTGLLWSIPAPYYFKVGRVVRYREADLDSWINEACAGLMAEKGV
jgi:predicted DNA-binding transcriptional regulator AlpA